MVSAPVGLSDLLISLTGELCLSSDCQGARVATRRAGGGRGEVVGCGRRRREKKWFFLLIGHIFCQQSLADERM